MLYLITAPDFAKKQVVFVFFNEGEKLAFSNDNLVVKDFSQKIKFQCSCYRIFIVFVVGHTSITTSVIQKAQKFGFYIALMTVGFRLYSIVGAAKDGNTLLKKKQYMYKGLDIARCIVQNKINTQISELKTIRNKNDCVKEAIETLDKYCENLNSCCDLNEIMAYEGLAAKLYFKNIFTRVGWAGRQPRLKKDYINSTLDIGYTVLFAFVDALLSAYGFDGYCGFLHRQFYMRKSLVCDFVEPFRVIIDHQIKKSINLKQIKMEDFEMINGQYKLKWKESARYVQFMMMPLMNHKEEIFAYIQRFYRAFMKDAPMSQYPVFEWRDI